MLLDKLLKNYLFSCAVSLNFNHLPRRKLSEKISENQANGLLKYIKDDLKVQQTPFSRVKCFPEKQGLKFKEFTILVNLQLNQQ